MLHLPLSLTVPEGLAEILTVPDRFGLLIAIMMALDVTFVKLEINAHVTISLFEGTYA